MIICIIFALQEEMDSFVNNIEILEEVTFLDFKYYIATYKNLKVIISKSGIGKVNSILNLTKIFNIYNIDIVINIGTAGGIKCEIGDIIIANKCIYFDVDLTAFNYNFGQMAGCPVYFKPNKKLQLITKEILLKKFNVYNSPIASGDTFVTSLSIIDKILKYEPNLKAIDMESTSISHVCYKYNIPFLIIKTVSDLINKDSSHDFKKNIKKCSENICKSLFSILETIRNGV